MEFGIYKVKSGSMTFVAIFVTSNGLEVKSGFGLRIFCWFFIGNFVFGFRFGMKIFSKFMDWSFVKWFRRFWLRLIIVTTTGWLFNG